MQQQIESVIFASEEAITLQVIRQVTGVEMDSAALQEVVEAINREYLESGRPFSIHRIAGGYRMLSREEFAPLLRKLQAPKIRRRLSRSILEVLSVVAYHQPVTRGEIQQIRGVSLIMQSTGLWSVGSLRFKVALILREGRFSTEQQRSFWTFFISLH